MLAENVTEGIVFVHVTLVQTPFCFFFFAAVVLLLLLRLVSSQLTSSVSINIFVIVVDQKISSPAWMWEMLSSYWIGDSSSSSSSSVPGGSPSCGGDVTVCVPDINQPSLPTVCYSVLVSVSVFLALSTVFHSINSPNNSPLSHSVLLVLFCLIGPLNHISLYESLPQPWYNPL